MEVYDIIMLAVLAIGVLFGAWKGLAWQVASLASVFASFFIACRFRGPVSEMINASPPWNAFLAMLLIFLGCSLVIWIAFKYVSKTIERVKLKEFDSHAGAALGFCRGVIWCVIITLFAVTLLGEAQQQKIIQSRSGYYIALLLDRSHAIMPEELHEVLAPYIHSLDETLGKHQRSAHQHDDAPFTTPLQIGEHGSGPGEPMTLPEFPQGTAEAAGDAVENWMRRFDEVRVGNREQPETENRLFP